jgi:hypothetical protein
VLARSRKPRGRRLHPLLRAENDGVRVSWRCSASLSIPPVTEAANEYDLAHNVAAIDWRNVSSAVNKLQQLFRQVEDCDVADGTEALTESPVIGQGYPMPDQVQ